MLKLSFVTIICVLINAISAALLNGIVQFPLAQAPLSFKPSIYVNASKYALLVPATKSFHEQNKTFVDFSLEFSVDLPNGQHRLSLSSITAQYPVYTVRVVADKIAVVYREVDGIEFVDGDSTVKKMLTVSHAPRLEIELLNPQTANGDQQFYTPREGMNLASILYNPMAWMMGVSLLMMFALPRLMASMDPEQSKEVAENQNSIAAFLQPVTTSPST